MPAWIYQILSICSRTDITFPLGIHPSPLLGLHCEGCRLPFLTFWMVFIHWRTVSYEGAGVPQPSLNIQCSRALLFNTMCSCINIILSVHEELPCSLLWSIAKQQLTLQRRSSFATAAIVPLALHIICVQSYETLYGSATIHSLLKWPIYIHI